MEAHLCHLKCPPASHIFFVDDVLLFMKAKKCQAFFLANVLDPFAKAAALKVNVMQFRVIFSIGVLPTKKGRLLI